MAHPAFQPAAIQARLPLTRDVTPWLWRGIGVVLVLLAVLPLARWFGGGDPGPIWAPHIQAWLIGIVAVVAGGVVAGRVAVHLEPRPRRRPAVSPWAFVGCIAGLFVVAASLAMREVFAANPHLVDEVAQLFHARVFASGRLAAPVPEPAESFLITHTWLTDAGWVSQYPPGQAVLLAPGLLLGLEWLVNPVLGGVGVVLVFLLARGLYGVRTALAAAFLWAASAWVLFMSATYMNHVGATTCALAAWALLWAPRRPRTWHWLGAGFFLAACAATRPLDGVAAAIPVALWLVLRRRRVVAAGWLALGGLPVAFAWGYLNYRLYGSPLTLGYTAVYGPEHGLGFHVDPWGLRYTPLVALGNAAAAVRRLNIYLFEWPIPALLPLVLWGLLGRQRRRADLLVALGIVAGPLLYALYWHSGFYPGPRFYYIAAPWLVIATARAWRQAWLWSRRRPRSPVRWDVALAVAACAVLVWGWVAILPARWDVYRTGLTSLKLHPERDIRAAGVTQALVLLPESWGSRVVVRLWGLGASPGLAERAYRRLDTCELHQFAVRARRAGLSPAAVHDSLERRLEEQRQAAPLVPGWPDWTLRLQPRDTLPGECHIEMDRDFAGFTIYGNHAWRNATGLDGGIVFARDLFERNDELLARYPGWEVWRFAPVDGGSAPPVLRRLSPAPASEAAP